ncbi:MAG TPA: type II secretion system protein M [Coxiellaceae bacterium]|nr:type II secretion system protein M [Coxiellaceae bacterium]
MFDNVKIWWNGLADRERRWLSIGGVFVGIFVIYNLMWSPLSSAVQDDAIQVKSQRALLIYMQNAAHTISQLQAEGIRAATTNATNILSLTEQNLSSHELTVFLKQVQQPEQNQVSLIFEKVPLDQLMLCLQQLSMTQGVHILSLTAERLAVAGTANVTVVLSS